MMDKSIVSPFFDSRCKVVNVFGYILSLFPVVLIRYHLQNERDFVKLHYEGPSMTNMR